MEASRLKSFGDIRTKNVPGKYLNRRRGRQEGISDTGCEIPELNSMIASRAVREPQSPQRPADRPLPECQTEGRAASCALRKHAIGGDRQNVKRVALREIARGIGLMVDDIERVAAGIESEFKVRGLARGSRIAGRILRPAQHEFLDLNGVQGISQREHADAVRAGIDGVKEFSIRADQRPAWTVALNGDSVGKGQVAGAIEREDADLIGPGEPGVDDVLGRVLGEAEQ